MIGQRYFPLKSADVRGAGSRDEPLRMSAGEAKLRKLQRVFVQAKKSKLTLLWLTLSTIKVIEGEGLRR